MQLLHAHLQSLSMMVTADMPTTSRSEHCDATKPEMLKLSSPSTTRSSTISIVIFVMLSSSVPAPSVSSVGSRKSEPSVIKHWFTSYSVYV